MSTAKFIAINPMFYSEIRDLVKDEIKRLGSQAKVAIKCDVSPATISLIVTDSWDGVREGMWRKVAASLDWRPQGWQVVETSNTRYLYSILADAQKSSLWLALSDIAGAGKTTGARSYAAQNRENTYYIECDEWNKGEFVKRFAKSLGISHIGCGSYYDLLDKIVVEFQQKAQDRPLIIVDQADKLRDAAFRCLIPLFNGLEDKAGCVIIGVGHLSKRIRRNAQLQTCGFDEIESRFGRRYINLPGNTRNDVAQICRGNGIDDNETIKRIWTEVWGDEKSRHAVGGREIPVVKDMRRLKRCVQRELLNLSEMPEPEAVAETV